MTFTRTRQIIIQWSKYHLCTVAESGRAQHTHHFAIRILMPWKITSLLYFPCSSEFCNPERELCHFLKEFQIWKSNKRWWKECCTLYYIHSLVRSLWQFPLITFSKNDLWTQRSDVKLVNAAYGQNKIGQNKNKLKLPFELLGHNIIELWCLWTSSIRLEFQNVVKLSLYTMNPKSLFIFHCAGSFKYSKSIGLCHLRVVNASSIIYLKYNGNMRKSLSTHLPLQ